LLGIAPILLRPCDEVKGFTAMTATFLGHLIHRDHRLIVSIVGWHMPFTCRQRACVEAAPHPSSLVDFLLFRSTK